MSLTATYSDAAGKVTLAVASAPSGTSSAHFERSTDQVTWTDVRGGQAVPVSGGVAVLIDYEYSPGLLNNYRVTYNAVPSFISKGAVSSVVTSGSLTPALPAGMAVGDLMLMLASTDGTASVQVPTPSGWSRRVSVDGLVVFWRMFQAGDTAPTVAFKTGNTTGCIAQIAAFRGTNSSSIQSASVRTNTTAQNVAYPALAASANGAALIFGFKSDNNTSVTAPSGYTLISNTSVTGNIIDTSAMWFYKLGVTKGTAIGPGTITVTGGTSQDSAGAVITLAGGGMDVASVTPDQQVVWLKNPVRPFLNRVVQVIGIGDQTRDSRSGLFDIIARTLPVPVTDLMSGRTIPLTLRAADPVEAADVDDMIAVGEVLRIHPPLHSAVPDMYALPLGSTVSRVANTSSARTLPLSFTECAMPDLSLAATQSTWQTVVNTYATWADLIADKATWSDVLLLVGTAEDVITS